MGFDHREIVSHLGFSDQLGPRLKEVLDRRKFDVRPFGHVTQIHILTARLAHQNRRDVDDLFARERVP
jgi:hypothetical protein